MQEAFDISLPDDLVIPQNNDHLQKAMEVIFQPGSQPYKNLIAALTEENKDKFGSSKFDKLQFEVKRFDSATLKGRLRIQYKLELTFSCSGIVNDLNNQHSYWNFETDRLSGRMHFQGDEYGDLRSTAGEF
jgi:hypothetical protein